MLLVWKRLYYERGGGGGGGGGLQKERGQGVMFLPLKIRWIGVGVHHILGSFNAGHLSLSHAEGGWGGGG